MVLCIWRSDNDAAGAVQPNIIVGVAVVEPHPLESDAHKVWVYRVEGFPHIPGAYTASATTLLNFFL
jgi:hypothetical protein